MTPSLSVGLEPAASSALVCDHQPLGDSFVTTESFLIAPGGCMVALGAVQSILSCTRRRGRRITGALAAQEGLNATDPPKASSPSPAPLSLQNPEVPQCLAHESRRKALAWCYYTKQRCRTSLHQSQSFPPLHTAAMSLAALLQNDAINPNRAKFC